MLASGSEVRFWAHTGQHLLGLSLTGFDPRADISGIEIPQRSSLLPRTEVC